LHVLVAPESLPLDAQYRLLELLRALPDRNSAVDLVVVCLNAALGAVSGGASPLLAQLGGWRRGPEPWSDARLKKLWQNSLARAPFSRGMQLLASAAPGAGKSFEARRSAAARGARYVYVRVNRTLAPRELAAVLRQRLQDAAADDDEGANDEGEEEGEGHIEVTGAVKIDAVADMSSLKPSSGARPLQEVCVHLDLAETVGAELDHALFALLVLGCLPNHDDGSSSASSGSSVDQSRLWWWDPSITSFAVEVKSSARFPSLSWMPRRDLVPSPEAFCADAGLLRAGWGEAAFTTSRFDGTLDVLAGLSGRADAPLPREASAEAPFTM
jgi:hypothetical protein